jgi:phosphoglycolate phosphatase-like HAD superfamily hydrolase
MAKVLALDFDGVIFDSIREAFTVALHTVTGRDATSRLAEHPLIAGRCSPDLFPFAEDPTFRAFLDIVPLGNRAEDYSVILSAIQDGTPVPDQTAYDRLYRGFDRAWLDEAHARFYIERARLRNDDFEAWRRLQPPYQHLIEVLRSHAGDRTLAIVTARDATSVKLLVEAWAVTDLFSSALVFDKSYGVRKTGHLEALMEKLSAAPSGVVFVDDKLNHLLQVAPLGVVPVLAAWGYNTPRERLLAERAGIAVAKLERAEELLFAA